MMARNTAIRFVLALLVALGTAWYLRGPGGGGPAGAFDARAAPASLVGDPALAAFQRRSSGRTLLIKGTVERVLADDRDGSPHQRFIVRSAGGVSLLIAHNLDLAPKLDGLKPGDAVTVLGEYEWNDKGGVMHWTHKDPQHKHAPGYIEWRGRRYQ